MKILFSIVLLFLGLFVFPAQVQATHNLALVEVSPHWQDTIHFTYTLPKQIKECSGVVGNNNRCARIQIICYQNTTLVLATSNWAQLGFILNSTSWTQGGGAECTSTLYYWDNTGRVGIFTPLDEINFTVLA